MFLSNIALFFTEREKFLYNFKCIIINELIKLMEDVNVKEIPEKENPKKYPILLEQSLFLVISKEVDNSN